MRMRFLFAALASVAIIGASTPATASYSGNGNQSNGYSSQNFCDPAKKDCTNKACNLKGNVVKNFGGKSFLSCTLNTKTNKLVWTNNGKVTDTGEVVGGNTGPWENVCLRSEKEVLEDTTIYPPQGDFEVYISENKLSGIEQAVPSVNCTRSTTLFPGQTASSWPLKTPWGCYFINSKPANDSILFIPLNTKEEWDSFVAATSAQLKDMVEIKTCNGDIFIPPPIPEPVNCGTAEPDVVFLIDSSGSIVGSGNYEKERIFIGNTIDAMAPTGTVSSVLGGGKIDGNGKPVPPLLANGNQFGWVTFAANVKKWSQAGNYPADGASPQKLASDLPGITGGNTGIGSALLKGYEIVKAMNGTGKKVIVLISDGYNNQSPSPTTVSQTIRDSGVDIIAVGVGGVNFGKLDINYNLLKVITGDANKVIPVSYDNMAGFTGNLATRICK